MHACCTLHLIGTVAECLVQTFKKSLKKSKLPPRETLQEFLMQYRRTPLLSGYSPSELLNGRQIRTKLDAMVPSPAHVAQGIQAEGAIKSQQKEQKVVSRFPHQYKVGGPCYVLYHGPQRDKDSRWMPAVITKVNGSRSIHQGMPKGTCLA